MKTPGQILKDMIADIISATDKVTYFGKDGVIRSMLHAVSYATSELWNDLYQTKRSIFVETATGADLDTIAARNGITRLGPSKSSVALILNGPTDVEVPAGTVVKSNLTGVLYETKSTIILRTNNPTIQRPIWSRSIGDVVIAESLEEGSISRVDTGELTQFQAPIAGVTVKNQVASIGGLDAETDEQLRERIINRISLLNQGTQFFYETLVKEIEPSVYKTFATFNPLNMGSKLYLIKNSFAVYTQLELDAIAADVYEKQRALSPVTCHNAGILSVEVTFEYFRNPDITQATIFSNIAQGIADLVDSNFRFGSVIRFQEILNIVIDTDGVDELKLNTLLVNNSQGNIVCSSIQVPRFTYLAINDGTQLAIIIEQQYYPLD